MRITVIGDGGWGTTLAIHLCNLGHNVKLWGVFPDYIETLNKKRENIKFLPSIKIPEKVVILSDAPLALEGAELILLAIPSRYTRDVLKRLKKHIPAGVKVVSAAKGLEKDTHLRMSEVISCVLDKPKVAVLSGPTIAYEVARSMPTTIVAASEDAELAREVQRVFMAESFRVYTSSDVVGVELGGALKNIIAIASGIADGLGFGANSKAAILTRGIQELTRLGMAMGAKKETFSGLTGMGDLITTCMSEHSRNRRFGEEIGKGRTPGDIIKSTEMAIEGYVTAKSAYELANRLKVEMPITSEVYHILYKGKDPKTVVKSLMARPPKDEIY